MKGTSVEVCRFDGKKCRLCGIVNEHVVPSGWATVQCISGMIEGSKVRVTHSSKHLQFCKIEIHGVEKGYRFEFEKKNIHFLLPKSL